MAEAARQWELALDQLGSADTSTYRRSIGFAAAIVALGAVVVAFAHIQLAAFPQFTTFHAGFVFLVDAITGLVLFGQFRYRRHPIYAMLGCAYLFNALVMVPFLLSFPGALKAEGGVIGGPQSAIWVWHFWHILFPALVIVSLVVEERYPNTEVPAERVTPAILAAVGIALALVAAVALAVTAFHDRLPVLIDPARRPTMPNFVIVGGLAAVVTAAAMLLAWRRGLRSRTILHLWLAVALTAFLADVAASLAANGRYTVGWYFGRVESMIAGSVLLLVFLGEINRLYRRLADAARDYSSANSMLLTIIEEREALLEDLQRSEQQVRQLAYYDMLTELPNRRLLLDRMVQALAQAKRHHYAMAVMFADLDRFKQINDTLGHEAGDELLRQVAGRLTACVRSGDTVSRSGGDEFIIVLPQIAHPGDAALVAEKMIQAVNEPVAVGSHSLHVTTSIGIAVYPDDDGDDVRELMNKADTAMYAAKEAGRNRYRFYGDLAAVPEK